LPQHSLHVRAAPSLDARAVCRARHLYRANLEAFSGRRVPHAFTLVRAYRVAWGEHARPGRNITAPLCGAGWFWHGAPLLHMARSGLNPTRPFGSCGQAARGPSHCPPLASRVAPVIQPAASEARKATISAMSSGVPSRPKAMVDTTLASSPGADRTQEPMSVSRVPAAMLLTVIRRAPSRFANVRAMVSSAALFIA